MPAAELTMTLTEDGQLQLKVGGTASGNRLLLLGMLETAKTLLLNPPAQPTAPPILLARGGLPNGRG